MHLFIQPPSVNTRKQPQAVTRNPRGTSRSLYIEEPGAFDLGFQGLDFRIQELNLLRHRVNQLLNGRPKPVLQQPETNRTEG